MSLDGGDLSQTNGSTTIPAGGTLIVYVAMDYAFSGVGNYKLNVRVESLQ